MIVTCPSCSAKFKIDSVALGSAGRKVRCSRCGDAWHQSPEVPKDVEAKAPVVEDSEVKVASATAKTNPSDEPQMQPEASVGESPAPSQPPGSIQKRERRMMVPGMLLAALVGVVLALMLTRSWVSDSVPGADAVYEIVGLGGPLGANLALRDLTSEIVEVDGETLLILHGKIVNESERTVDLPALEARLSAADGSALQEWTFIPEENRLPPGGEFSFSTQNPDPPNEATVTLSFVER